MGTLKVNGDILVTSPQTIYANNIIPNNTNAYIIGTSEKEYASTYSRQVFTRHIEPATNVNNDVYICYNNRGGCIRAYAALSMEGICNIVNLPIGGGIYWNPYVESAEDGTDAASITLHANGVGGGTELRITMANDGNDVINLNPASWVYLQGKAAFRVDDSWLRINETSSFGSGIYTGTSCMRTDNQFQVGDSGTAFLARIDGYGRFKYKLDIGAELSLWADNEGGNIWLHSGNGHVNTWEIDSYNGNLRMFTYRERDGAYVGNQINQENGWWDAANYAYNADHLQGLTSGSFARTFFMNHNTFNDLSNNGCGNMTYCSAADDGTLIIGREWGWNNEGNNFGMQLEVSGWDGTLRTRCFRGWSTGWGNWLNYIHDGNIGSQSVNYANESGSSYKLISTGDIVTNTLQYLCTSSAFDYGNWQYDIIMSHGGSDYRTILQFPYWGTPRYRKMESSVWGNYQNFHTTENVIVQSNTPGAGFQGQIWLQI